MQLCKNYFDAETTDGQGPWGGRQHGWISCPAHLAQIFK